MGINKDFIVKNGLNVVSGNITIGGLVDGRDLSVDGTKLDGIESGATGDMTATEILTAVKTVDGTGSGLDADLLDGQDGSYYLDWSNVTNKPDPVITLGGDLSGSVTLTDLASGTLTASIQPNSVALGTDTTGDYVSGLTAGTGVVISGTAGEGWSPTVAIGQAVGTTSDVEFRNMVLSGNLTINGTTTTVNATNLAIEDNIIYLNEGSAIANPDIGIVGNFNDGTYSHTGIFRDATDARWKFFKRYDAEPGQTIDTANATFQYADVQANTFYGELSGNATTVTNGVYTVGNQTINGVKTFANSVVLNAGINASGTLGTSGQVLTSNGTAVYWSTVTGGGGGGGGPVTMTVSDTAPVSPTAGEQWFNSADGSTNIYYNDGDSSQWVTFTGPEGPQGQKGYTGSQGYTGSRGPDGLTTTFSDTTPVSPTSQSTWLNTSDGTLNAYYNDGDSTQWVGIAGSEGPQGPRGYAGSAGYTGSKGTDGLAVTFSDTTPTPVTGLAWLNTADGTLNAYINDGDSSQWIATSGPEGSQGPRGYTGSQGPIGPSGGYTGSKGDTGAQGPIGYTGSKGSDGVAGFLAETSSTAPSTPSNGHMWFDTNDATLAVYYNDGDSSQWVTVSGPRGLTGYTGSQGIPGAYAAIGYTGSKGDPAPITSQAIAMAIIFSGY